MLRILSIAAALATSTMVLGATSAHAQTGGYYTAVPAVASGKPNFISSGTLWTWRDSAYTARKGDSRDAIQCQMVAKQAGKLTAFSAGGNSFDASALDKCNAKAK